MPEIFLSYARQDEFVARRIRNLLAEHDYDVWFDAVDFALGEPFRSVMERKIRDADVFLVLCTSNSLKSHWVRSELDFALYAQRSIIAVLLEELTQEDLVSHWDAVLPNCISLKRRKPDFFLEQLVTKLVDRIDHEQRRTQGCVSREEALDMALPPLPSPWTQQAESGDIRDYLAKLVETHADQRGSLDLFDQALANSRSIAASQTPAEIVEALTPVEEEKKAPPPAVRASSGVPGIIDHRIPSTNAKWLEDLVRAMLEDHLTHAWTECPQRLVLGSPATALKRRCTELSDRLRDFDFVFAPHHGSSAVERLCLNYFDRPAPLTIRASGRSDAWKLTFAKLLIGARTGALTTHFDKLAACAGGSDLLVEQTISLLAPSRAIYQTFSRSPFEPRAETETFRSVAKRQLMTFRKAVELFIILEAAVRRETRLEESFGHYLCHAQFTQQHNQAATAWMRRKIVKNRAEVAHMCEVFAAEDAGRANGKFLNEAPLGELIDFTERMQRRLASLTGMIDETVETLKRRDGSDDEPAVTPLAACA